MAETLGGRSLPARSIPLDVLRGIAILLFLGHHQVAAAIPADGPRHYIGGIWRRFGWIGVDLFFVLSGFVVGGLIFPEINRHGDFDAWRFVRRRWLRTLPLYVAFLAFFYLFIKPSRADWW